MSIVTKIIGTLNGVFGITRVAKCTQMGVAPVTVDALADVQITATAATQKALVVQAAAAQSANIMEWQKSDGTVLASMNSVGDVTYNDGLIVSGGLVSLNASSNFNTVVNTGTSTGTVSIGNSVSGALVVASGAASTLTVTGASLTISTATSGTFALTSAGALNLSQAAASTWTGTGGMTYSGGAMSINASSNFNTTLNTGTSTGTVGIGNSLAGALTIASGASSTLTITGGSFTTATTGANNIALNPGAGGAVTMAPTAVAAGAQTLLVTPPAHTAVVAEVVDVQVAAHTQAITGSYATDREVVIGAKTFSGAFTVTTAAGLQVNGPLPGTSTLTNTIGIDVPTWVTNGTTASGIRIAAPSGATANWALNVTSGGITVAGASTIAGLLTASAGATVSGAATAINASSNFNTTINTGTSTGTVGIGNSLAGALALASGAASSFTVTGAALTLQTLTSGAIVANSVGAFTLTSGAASTWAATGGITISVGLVTMSAGLAVTGAASSINASSNFNTSINTGTSTGVVGIGNSGAGAVTVASGAASSFTVTGGSLTLQTLTSGAIVANSVGAITLTSASASTWAATGGITISVGLVTMSAGLAVTGAASSINASSNFNTSINTGTSTGTVGIGNSLAGALTIASGASSTLTITGGAWTMATTGANNIALNPGAGGAVTIAPTTVAGGANALTVTPAAHTAVVAEVIDVNQAAHTLAITGSYATQRSAVIGATTFSGAFTVTTAIALQVNGAIPGSSTLTNTVGIDVPTWATNGTTASGLRIAAPTGAATNWAINVTSGNVAVGAGLKLATGQIDNNAAAAALTVTTTSAQSLILGTNSTTRYTVDSNGIMTAGAAAWIQNTSGEGALSVAFTRADATLTATNLSYTVIAGRSYRIYGVLQVSNSTTTEGVQIDFNGGSATATTFFMAATMVGTNVAVSQVSVSLAGVINYSTVTGTDYIILHGYLKVANAGTLILRAAENTTAAGTMTMGAGSWIALEDTVRL